MTASGHLADSLSLCPDVPFQQIQCGDSVQQVPVARLLDIIETATDSIRLEVEFRELFAKAGHETRLCDPDTIAKPAS